MRIKILLAAIAMLFFFAPVQKAAAQTDENVNDNLVQFSGIVLTSDSLMGLPGVSIRIKNTRYGTASTSQGIFSLVARKTDTVLFSYVGYKNKSYVVPASLTNQRYSMIITLTADTNVIDTIVVKPFISRSLFQQYFVTMEAPEDEQVLIAKKNLESELLKQQAFNMGADGPENQKLQQRQESYKYYYAGQLPPQNIFNPIAWGQFFKAWKNGAFKKKKTY